MLMAAYTATHTVTFIGIANQIEGYEVMPEPNTTVSRQDNNTITESANHTSHLGDGEARNFLMRDEL